MSEHNISQILAALAAQKGDAVPAQGPPIPTGHPPTHPGYQNPYLGPTPQVNAHSFALPQPSSSGSLDLSNIKPTNSGSVNFEDAVTRARGLAAEKRLSYDQGRGALQGSKMFRRSRSRSRSPPRGGGKGRDSYRDNYNPYRDERRDDMRRTNGPGLYESTISPIRQPVEQFQPPYAGLPDDRMPQSYGADPGIETITIESSLVGLIIGRQGENLRRVETDTGTRVQFMTGPESTGPHRLCKITGPRSARDAAKAEINRIIEENGNAARGNVVAERAPPPSKTPGSHQPALRVGEDTTQIMVPNRTVGLIIGRGGETIRDLQERSGCHVNIVGEEKSLNGLRPVNLIGTPAAAEVAKDLIMEIVDSDNKSLASGGAPGSLGPGAVPGMGMAPTSSLRGGADPASEKINDLMMVPSDAVGMIIGKGGETIKDMQIVTGCKINVSQPSGQDLEREIGLVGTRGAIEHAKRAIMEKVRAVEEKNRSGGGGGGGGRQPPQDQYNRYSQQQYPPQGGAPSQYPGQPQQQYPQQQAGGMPATAPNGEDPYSAYGGYQNYLAMWYAAIGQQQQAAQGQMPMGQSHPGPGPPQI